MAPGWQEIASLHVEQITGYVRETLSTGLGYLKSELGIDLGLNPDLCAPWLLLLTAWGGLVLILIVWVSVCRGLSKRLSGTETEENIADNTGPAQTVKADEPRRRNRKRNAEKVCIRSGISINLVTRFVCIQNDSPLDSLTACCVVTPLGGGKRELVFYERVI